jgi:antirestriction protein ArdC
MRPDTQQSSTRQSSSTAAERVSLYDEVTSRIVAEMEQGVVPWVRPWSRSAAPLGMPRSAATAKFYSGINILILWEAVIRRGYAAQNWLTFKQALSLGGNVRKGERGTVICYADSFVPKSERERARDSGDDPSRVPFLKRFTVFNIEQCDGLPAHVVPPAANFPETDRHPGAESLITASAATIREGGGEAYYHEGEDFIRLPPSGSFLTPADFYCTALHELGHWTAHPKRLARDLSGRFGSTAYAREELIAELCSAFLCAHLGIVPQVRHADYLANWLAVLKSDSRAIFHAASQASKACDFLLSLPTQAQAGAPVAA